MKTSSAKAKGRRLSQALCDALMKTFEKDLLPGDILVTPSGVNGPDVSLSPSARQLIPLEFECKNVEKLNLWTAIAQAQTHAISHGRHPAIVINKNHMKTPWAAVPLPIFLSMLKDHAVMNRLREIATEAEKANEPWSA